VAKRCMVVTNFLRDVALNSQDKLLSLIVLYIRTRFLFYIKETLGSCMPLILN
jgi:hypothetical protein